MNSKLPIKEKFGPTYQVLIAYLFFAFFFYAYRYPLGYNDEGTSGSYSATPFAFQAAKYFVTVVFIFAISISYFLESRPSRVKPSFNLPLLTLLFCIFLYSKVLFVTDSQIEASYKTLFFFPILLVASLFDLPFDAKRLIRIFLFFLAINLICDLAQVILYVAMGRLPALAYAGGKIGFARFGGLWDDPNAFACFLMLPLAFLLSDYKNKSLKRKFFIAAGVMMLILTLSITGLIMLIALFLMDSILKRKNVYLLLFFGFLLLGFLLRDLGFIVDIIAVKAPSVEEHADVSSMFDKFSLINIPFGNPTSFFAPESFFLGFFVNFGLIPFLIFVLLQVVLLRRVYLYSDQAKRFGYYFDSVFFRGAFLFFLCFFLGNLFLPFFSVYPVNFIFWFLVVVTWNRSFSPPWIFPIRAQASHPELATDIPASV